MAKYSYELKKRVVHERLNGATPSSLSHKYNIPKKYVRSWVSAYRQNGDDALRIHRSHNQYDHEYKLEVVLRYLNTEKTYMQLASELGIPNHSIIAQWVSIYRIHGPEGLIPKKRGRKTRMSSNDFSKTTGKEPVDKSKDAELEQLREENYKLKLRLAILKESRRLRLLEEMNQGAKQ